ncbi:hypothetical protein AN639_09855 [Candidatus Epulonipiscium fishelsonii]|uniref:Uncharacterized protein n=1 Tax=Candidatus Epulonipiscium fishelsonii TaxID=77094 RepID=A0ACC8XED0_9FIRM|nr:hypothetical protein AN396_03935 [Epulopiscium sp. SCG-B11WGA-EpuloA1]ONI43809.1 hypothetical protein AN639_09855 [Epulopiscium sp. SCG-B05WGA-EpuloA1]
MIKDNLVANSTNFFTILSDHKDGIIEILYTNNDKVLNDQIMREINEIMNLTYNRLAEENYDSSGNTSGWITYTSKHKEQSSLLDLIYTRYNNTINLKNSLKEKSKERNISSIDTSFDPEMELKKITIQYCEYLQKLAELLNISWYKINYMHYTTVVILINDFKITCKPDTARWRGSSLELIDLIKELMDKSLINLITSSGNEILLKEENKDVGILIEYHKLMDDMNKLKQLAQKFM